MSCFFQNLENINKKVRVIFQFSCDIELWKKRIKDIFIFENYIMIYSIIDYYFLIIDLKKATSVIEDRVLTIQLKKWSWEV